MRSEILSLLVLFVVSSYATTAAVEPSKADEPRSFVSVSNLVSFTTFTLIKATTTSTSTLTSTTTCTTSTAALSTCTVGGRRRGLFFDESASRAGARRGLFYDDAEVNEKDGHVFLPSQEKRADPVDEAPAQSVSEDAVIPLEVQAGFSVPEGVDNSRFLLAFGTTTVIKYTVTTKTSSLTAICSSTTGFALCASGK